MTKPTEYRYGEHLIAITDDNTHKPNTSYLTYATREQYVRKLTILIDPNELEDIVESEMSVHDKIHWKTMPYGVREAMKTLPEGRTPQDFVSDDDLGVYVLEQFGARSMGELHRLDRAAWNLVRKRNLTEKIFTGGK